MFAAMKTCSNNVQYFLDLDSDKGFTYMTANNKRIDSCEQMNQWQQLAFGAALLERMYPNYRLFTAVTESEGAAQFRNILNLVWEHLSGKNNTIDFGKQLDKLERVTPDPACHDLYGVWPALDAAVSLSSLLSACLRWEPAEIETIQKLSSSTIEGYLEAVDDDSEDGLSELEQAEFSLQQQLLTLIDQVDEVGKSAVINQIKSLIKDYGVSNIGLELV